MENFIKMRINRYALPRIIKEYGYKCGAEIGILRGYFSRFLLANCEDITLHGVDPYIPHSAWEFGWGYVDEKTKTTQESHDGNKKCMLAITNKYKNFIFHNDKSINFGGSMVRDEFDFIVLDGDHSEENVYRELNIFYEKIKDNGIICGHDFNGYFGKATPVVSVKPAVERFCRENNLSCIISHDNFYFHEGIGSFFIKKGNFQKNDLHLFKMIEEQTNSEKSIREKHIASLLESMSRKSCFHLKNSQNYIWQDIIFKDSRKLETNVENYHSNQTYWECVSNDIEIKDSDGNLTIIIYDINRLILGYSCDGIFISSGETVKLSR